MPKKWGSKKRPKPQPSHSEPAASSNPAAEETQGSSNRTSSFVSGALPLLQSAIKIASEAAGDAAVPGLSIGLSALAEILEQILTMRKTGEGVETLQDRVRKLSKIVTDFCSRPQALLEERKQRIEMLSQSWKDIAERTKHIASRGKVKRFLMAKSDAEELEGLMKEISDSIQQDFLIDSLLSIEGGVAEANAGIQKIRRDVRVILDDSFMSLYAKRAHYNANKVRKACLEGTRVDLLEELWIWILAACMQTGVIFTYIVYWINGLAGTGKTTIAMSIAERCEAAGLLAASFFCARDDTECNKPDLVFVTIARQLCSYFPPLKDKVAEVLSQNPTLVYSNASTQFEKLILEPLEKLECDFPRAVVVIDALDECHETDENATSTIVGIIAKFDTRIAPYLAFLVTSRPERSVTFRFDESGTLKDATTRLLLHEVKLELVSDDICQYFLDRFSADVLKYHRLPTDWLSSGELSMLVELSHGLFIWAATAFRFIVDRTVCDPKGQLRELLSVQSTSQRRAGSTVLDSLYDQISEAAFANISETLANRLQSILGTIVLAQEPLSVATLEKLIGIEANDIRRTLDRLHSVLHIPDTDDEPIRIIHPTFAEYLLGPPSAKPGLFSINAAMEHAHFLSRTLRVIEELKTNIAELPTPSTFRREVPGLNKTVKERISAAVSYSCRYWSAHLEQCGDAGQITAMLDTLVRFFRTQLLKWLEVSSLLGVLDKSIASLQAARTACQGYGDSFVSLSELIFDCLRFTQTYAPRIHDAPLQLYHSLVALAPEGSLVKQQYTQGLDQSLLITRGALPDWGPCIDTIIGHNRTAILSVSFSSDGAFFATGGRDGHVRIWRTATRTSVKAIPAGDGYHRVAFSPDGAQVASTPNLRIWDVKTSDVVRTLEHMGAEYVAYSADGARLASGSDGAIKLWDPLTGTCLDTIASVHAQYPNGMAISPDGTLVGGNDEDKCAVTYNTSSRVSAVVDREWGGYVAAFSPDGSYVASRASGTAKIRTLKDKLLVRTIDASSHVYSVAFSHSSTQIGCGCNDGRIRIWTIASDDPPRVLAGHTNAVTALAWSPDDTQVISVSDDGTIRLWDLTRHRGDTMLAASPPSSFPPLPGAPCYAVLRTPETTALFSLPAPIQPSTAASDAAEDALIITLHADMAAAWDAILRGGGASGEFVASRDWAFLTGRLHANRNEAWKVAGTDDGSVFAHQSRYERVQVYNRHTGNSRTMFLQLSPSALAISADSSHLAVAVSETLRIWDVASPSDNATPRVTLDCPSRAVAFSHDNSLLVAGVADSDAHIHDATTGQSVRQLHNTRGEVTQIAFSADNRHVIAQTHPWLIIWDAATGEQILELTLTHDHLLYSFDFATDDTGILIPDGKGGTTRVTLWSPGEHKWPAYTVTEDGWLYAKSPGKVRRLCWLPPEWRAVFPLGGPRFCAPDREQRRVVVFDVSRIPEYVETWGAESEGALTG